MTTESKSNKFPLSSMDVSDEKRRQLKQLFPEAFTEARDPKTGELKHAIDWEKLKASLGDVLEKEGERFGLTWPGKSGLLKIIQQPSVGTLKPCREESVNFEGTENLFIEGDNLEVLKLLQKSYFGKVKMIYIDPPYNTGNEFVYPDNFTESLETYLQYTGMVDAKGRKFSTNAATEGRFHSKWLNMMYPRLFLARNLLREDGVVFLSIDDNEVKNLRGLCDEIFGEESFVAQVIWEGAFKNDARQIGTNHEYVIVYSKNPTEVGDSWTIRKEGVDPILDEVKRLHAEHGKNYEAASKDLAAWYRANKSKASFAHRRFRYIDARGAYKEDDPTAPGGRKFDLVNPKTGTIIPLRRNRGWSFDQARFNQLVKENRISFITETSIMVRRYLHETDRVTPQSVIYQPARSASERLSKLIGGGIFEFPKDEMVISQFIDMATFDSSEPAIILDFFSGSCTTAHAVLDLNKQDGGNRKFIMVQLPELCDEKSDAYKTGYKTIADIGKERIRRVISKMKKEREGEFDLDSGSKIPDLGFRVFKLAPSNFKTWQGDETDPDKIREQLEFHVNHIDPQATPEDILYELLLKAGFPLTTPVEKIEIANKTAYSVADGALIICLDDNLTKEAIRAIADRKPVQAICLDAAFHENDQLKTNAVQIMESAEVQFRTV